MIRNEPESVTNLAQTAGSLLDHLIPSLQEDWGDRQAERLGGLVLVVTAWKELGRISRMLPD
jgi:hypothetical protein